MDSEKSINLFEIRTGYLIIYGTIFFENFLITSQNYYYAKYLFLTSLIWLIHLRFLLYRKVLKF